MKLRRVIAAAAVVMFASGCATGALPDASRTALDPAGGSVETAAGLAPAVDGAAVGDSPTVAVGDVGGAGDEVYVDTAGVTPQVGQVAQMGGGDAVASNGQNRTGSLAPSSSFYDQAAADPDRQPGATHTPWTPPVRPSTGPTITTGGATDAQVVELIHQYFAPEEWGRAAAIAQCESGMRSVTSKPNRNGTRDWGIFQFNDGGTLQSMLRRTGYAETDLQRGLDPAWNVQAAAIYHGGRGPGGWSPWSCAHRLGIVAGLWSPVPGPNADKY